MSSDDHLARTSIFLQAHGRLYTFVWPTFTAVPRSEWHNNDGVATPLHLESGCVQLASLAQHLHPELQIAASAQLLPAPHSAGTELHPHSAS